MRRNNIILIMTLALSVFGMISCDELEVISPPGPRGLSSYEVWVEAVKKGEIVWTDGTDLPNYMKFLRGDKGKSAYITWVEWVKEGKVDDPHNSGKKWSAENTSKKDFYKYLTGAKGDDGLTPFINDKGNWQIGTQDTGIPARGPKGDKGEKGNTGEQGPKGDNGSKGQTGEQGPKGDNGDKGQAGQQGPKGDNGDKGQTGQQGPKGDNGSKGQTGQQGPKGDNGNQGPNGDQGPKGDNGTDGDTVELKNGVWHINGQNTGIKARGEQGEKGNDGEQGLSAYQLWVEEVKKGTIQDKNGNVWKDTETTLQHFWEFLKGKNGKNGNGGNSTSAAITYFKLVSFGPYNDMPDGDPVPPDGGDLGDPMPIPKPIPKPMPIPKPHPQPGPGDDGESIVVTTAAQPSKDDYRELPHQGGERVEIVINTEPGAVIYMQFTTRDQEYIKSNDPLLPGYFEGMQKFVYGKKVPEGEHTNYKLILSVRRETTVHIWAKVKGKISSYQHHLDLSLTNPHLGNT